MKAIDEYLRHAEECEALARGNINAEEREMIKNMADTWRMLAKRREQMLAMRQDRENEISKQPDENKW